MGQRASVAAGLGPEHTILLACARSDLTRIHVAQVKKAADAVDWAALWALAHQHGVGYFVGRHLQVLFEGPHEAADGLCVPREFIQLIREDSFAQTANAMLLLDCQKRLTAGFEQAGIPVLWLKGLALSQELYASAEARQCGDLDLLVDPRQLPQAEACFRDHGMRRYPNPVATKDLHPMAAHHSTWSAGTCNDRSIVVELHHRLSGPLACQPAADKLIHRSRFVELSGCPMRVPSLEDGFLILCLHAHQHQFALLRCLMDIAEYLRCHNDRLDWSRLLTEARACRALGRLRIALEITEETLGLDGMGAVLQQLPALLARQRWARQKLSPSVLLDPDIQLDELHEAQLALFMDRWSDMLRYYAPRLAPSNAYLRALCPGVGARVPGFPWLNYIFRIAARLLGGMGRRKAVRHVPKVPRGTAELKKSI